MVARVQPARQTRSSSRLLPPKQPGIQAFAKSTKAASGKLQGNKDVIAPKKRKLEEVKADDEEETIHIDISSKTPKKAKVDEPSQLGGSTSVPASSKTDSLSILSRLTASSPEPSLPIHKSWPSQDTLPRSKDESEDVPRCFHDFTSLHSSFLTALSLHFTHNGLSAPADFSQLLPSVEKIWKKRKVEKEDIQKLLYILNGDNGNNNNADAKGQSPQVQFRICNYGLGKICLERLDTGPPKGTFQPPIKERELSERFIKNLEELWEQKVRVLGYQKAACEFVDTIPLTPIYNTLTTFTSFHVGRQRLLDLKAGQVKLKSKNFPSPVKNEAAKRPRVTNVRQNGLLERIQSKQLKQSKLPPPPSKETITRESAANHIESIADILALLRYPTATNCDLNYSVPRKKPYKVDILVQIIQDSMKNPISKQEVEACLDMLAHPSVAGDWVSIVTVHRLKSVVLQSGKSISARDIGAKVAAIQPWK